MAGHARDLESHVAVVTGGSQGIGLAATVALAERGMTVAALSRSQERLDQAIAALAPELRSRVFGLATDVRDDSSVARAVGEIVERTGRIDVLVNSAGLSMTAKRRLVDTTTDEWHGLIDTNLTGTYLMCREVLPHLEARGGYVINVLSTAAFASQPGVSLYAASKFGARALTEALVEEYRESGVRVTSVSPGPVDTTIWTHKVAPPTDEERARMMRPSDIAEIFVWLLDRPRSLHIRDITVTPWTGSKNTRS